MCQGQILQASLGRGINTPKSLSLDTYPFVCSCQEKLDLEKLQWLLKAFLKKCASVLPSEPLDSLSLFIFSLCSCGRFRFFIFFLCMMGSELVMGECTRSGIQKLFPGKQPKIVTCTVFWYFGARFSFWRARLIGYCRCPAAIDVCGSVIGLKLHVFIFRGYPEEDFRSAKLYF